MQDPPPGQFRQLPCGLAFLLTPTYWPLIAAAIPLGTMLAWFPRAG